jgi:glycerol-3-phosphate dehydrogenase
MHRPTLAELAATTHDLLVVGGGIIGCGAARDAALRGLRVALVEQADFGSGTTSRSTRLIHGGLRYLELFDFGLVREDLREREILLHVAPHLVRPLPFLVPIYGWNAYHRLRLRAGMLLYDLLSFDRSLPGHDFLSREQALAAEPALDPDNLLGAARYYDAQVGLPERLCFENALDAAAHGGLLRNYTRVERLLVEDGVVVGAEVADSLSGQRGPVRARRTLLATGAWLDRTLASCAQPARPLLRTTRGVHLVTSPLGDHAVVLFARRDRRLFFVVPWRGTSLIGTTDTDEAEPPESVRADRDDVDYLLDETRRAFPGAQRLQPYYAMAGVRALVRREGVGASQVSRRHKLLDHAARGGPDGLISILGGKITAYRAIAEQAVDLVCRQLGRQTVGATDRLPLPGKPAGPERLLDALAAASAELPLDDLQRQHLAALYGQRALSVLDLARGRPALSQRAGPNQPTILAEALLAARDEAVVNLADVMLRRTGLGLSPDQGRSAAERVAATVGEVLGWSEDERAAQLADYTSVLTELYALPGPPPAQQPA